MGGLCGMGGNRVGGLCEMGELCGMGTNESNQMGG